MDEQTINTVQDDVVVQLAYELVVDDEEIEANTMEYLHGHQNIIPGLEEALTGLQLGDTKQILVLAKDAYGEYDPDSIVFITRASFPPDFEIRLGEPMRLRDSQGHVFSGIATALTEENVELDLNHPMAGKDLNFSVKVLGLRPATEVELAVGGLQGGCDSCGSEGCGSEGCSSGCCG